MNDEPSDPKPSEPSTAQPANEKHDLQKSYLPYGLGMLGAIIGAVLGGYLFLLALDQGYYMLALPGALIGIGCGLMSRRTSIVLGVFCMLLAAGVTLYLEWCRFDETFGEFISTLDALPQTTFVMYGLGVLFAGWFGYGRSNRA